MHRNASAYYGLALDLDGTLLSPDGTLDERMAGGLRKLRDRSIQILLVSGRMEAAVLRFWRQIGLHTPIISYNGARIAVPGQPPLQEDRLPPPLCKQVIRYCRDRGLHLNLYLDDRLYVLADSPLARWYAGHYGVPLHLLDVDRAESDPPASTKLLVMVEEETALAPTFQALRAAFGRDANLTTSSRRFIEILPPGVDKGAALRRVADHLGVPPHAWVAVGDGMNDLEMIQAAGLGVAIETGEARLQALARLVIPPLPAGGLERLLALFAFDNPGRDG
jgi:Cof subfamily protein (haloacid dehalogenase superfamily)